MHDAEWIAFLQWALPRMGMRWAGFRKVRRQVRRRVTRRLEALQLPDLKSYRSHLETHSGEWSQLDTFCRITISRFRRDRGSWDTLCRDVLPAVARVARRDGRAVKAWSAGCAGGEEPYTLCIAWRLEVAPDCAPDLPLEVLATDADPTQLERARRARYGASSLREAPQRWRDAAFDLEPEGSEYTLRAAFRQGVTLALHDVRTSPPRGGPFDLVLCRNLAFTYLDEACQRQVCAHFRSVLVPGGVLVTGSHETPPDGTGFTPIALSSPGTQGMYGSS